MFQFIRYPYNEIDKGREGHWNNKNITQTGVKMACSAQTHPKDHQCFINDQKFQQKRKRSGYRVHVSLYSKEELAFFFAL